MFCSGDLVRLRPNTPFWCAHTRKLQHAVFVVIGFEVRDFRWAADHPLVRTEKCVIVFDNDFKLHSERLENLELVQSTPELITVTVRV